MDPPPHLVSPRPCRVGVAGGPRFRPSDASDKAGDAEHEPWKQNLSQSQVSRPRPGTFSATAQHPPEHAGAGEGLAPPPRFSLPVAQQERLTPWPKVTAAVWSWEGWGGAGCPLMFQSRCPGGLEVPGPQVWSLSPTPGCWVWTRQDLHLCSLVAGPPMGSPLA